MLFELGHIVRVFDHSVIEGRVIGPKGDQHFLGVAAERVAEELDGHQRPPAIAACRFSSRSFVLAGGLLPTATPSSGTNVATAVPFAVVLPLSNRSVAGGVPR